MPVIQRYLFTKNILEPQIGFWVDKKNLHDQCKIFESVPLSMHVDACLRCQTEGKQEECVGELVLTVQ